MCSFFSKENIFQSSLSALKVPYSVFVGHKLDVYFTRIILEYNHYTSIFNYFYKLKSEFSIKIPFKMY